MLVSRTEWVKEETEYEHRGFFLLSLHHYDKRGESTIPSNDTK